MNTMRTSKILSQHVYGIFVIAILAVTCSLKPAFAEEKIKAKYIQPRGDHISWKLRIPKKLPAAIIIIQYIRPGSNILDCSHPLSSYDEEKGIAKWLITPSSPGILKMDMKISKPILKKGQIRGEVMFKDDSDNTTASFFREPRTKKRAYEGC